MRLVSASMISAMVFAAPALAEPLDVAKQVVAAMDFDGRYAGYVEEMVAASDEWAPDLGVKAASKFEAQMRSELLANQAAVGALFEVQLAEQRSELELQQLLGILQNGVSLEDLPPHVSYSLDAAVASAMMVYMPLALTE